MASAVILALASGFGISALVHASRDPLSHAGYLETDADLVARTIADYAQANHADAERAMGGRFPVVITLDDRKCVNLKLRPGFIGFSPVYCYDRTSDRLVYRRIRQM